MRSLCLCQFQPGWSQLTRDGITPDPSVFSIPSVTLGARKAFLSTFGDSVPLSDQSLGMVTKVGLILEHALEGEDVGDDLTLPGMLNWITGTEGTWAEGRGRVIVDGFQASASMAVDNFEGLRFGDRYVVRSDT